MSITIKTFSDGSVLEFDKGNFDDHCVYLTRPNIPRTAPTDVQYFTALQQYGVKYGNNVLYEDFVSFYILTNKLLNPSVLNTIETLSAKYKTDSLNIEIIFTIIYSGMIAEENKKYTKLGKRVKRLGMHQVLIEMMPPSEAANYSKGKKWKALDTLMKQKGF